MIEWWLAEGLGGQGELLWTAEPWIIATAVAMALCSVFVVFRRTGTRKVAELLCWLGALCILVWGVAEPYWVTDAGRTEPGRSVVLIDESRSMSVTEKGVVRGKRAAQILERLGPNADVYRFSNEVLPGQPREWNGTGTDIGLALRTIEDRYLGQSLQSISLITDGIDRGTLKDVLQSGSSALLPKLPGPLTVYQVGQQTGIVDHAVTDRTGGLHFCEHPFSLRPICVVLPVAASESPCVVKVVWWRPFVDLDAEGNGVARFEVTPTEVGRYIWKSHSHRGQRWGPKTIATRLWCVWCATEPGFCKCVVRPAMTKSSCVCLKKDPSIDLVSFFILRTHEDFSAGWYPEELSLIAFPYEHLFTDQRIVLMS